MTIQPQPSTSPADELNLVLAAIDRGQRCDYTGLYPDQCAHCHGNTSTVITIGTIERTLGRPAPQYRYRARRWQVPEPQPTSCDHQTNALCKPCDLLLDQLLFDMPYLVHELGVTSRKQGRFAPHGMKAATRKPCTQEGCTGKMAATKEMWICELCKWQIEFSSPIPWDQGASRMLHALKAFQQQPHTDRRQLLVDLSNLIHRGHQVIERPDNMLFLGPCPTCKTDLWAEKGDDPACECGYRTTWASHHEQILNQLEDRLMTVAEIVTLYRAAGQTITRNRVNNLIRWRHIDTQQLTVAHWRGALGIRTEPITVLRLGDFRIEHDKTKTASTVEGSTS